MTNATRKDNSQKIFYDKCAIKITIYDPCMYIQWYIQ